MNGGVASNSIASGPSMARWWQAGLAVLLVLSTLLGVYGETAMAMVEIWHRSETFAHAFVVPPISLWLIWRQRQTLLQLTPQASLLFLFPLALFAFAWLLGETAAVNALTQFALVGMLVASVPLLLGWSVAKQIAFPLVFLFFCVPVGEFMMPTLMEMTADFTVAALRLSGIPVYREGLQFVIPSGNWSVVEACSGLRYLIASVMVGTLFAYLNYQSWRRRLVFIVVATLLPLLANWLRAYLIVMLGHLSSNKLAAGADHLVYGWVFFGVVMLALFMIGARWSEPDAVRSAPDRSAAPLQARRAIWPGAVLATLVALTPLLVLKSLPTRPGAVTFQVPELAAWQKVEASAFAWSPAFVKPAAQVQRDYAKDGRQVGLHLAFYREQNSDSKLITSSNQLVSSEDKRWVSVGASIQSVTLDHVPVTVRSHELRSAGQLGGVGERLQVWQFYWIGGKLTSSTAKAKLYGALQSLSGQGDDGASVIIYTVKDADNPEAADVLLRAFAEQNWPSIAAELKRASDAGQ
jgi:exosortase A